MEHAALPTAFTELVGCPLPIQQAPMGGVAATPELAAAVSEAGGLGMIAAVRVPAPALSEILDGVEQRTAGAVGVNFLMPFLDREAVELAAGRVRVVDFFYDDPDEALVEAVHAGGALAAWQVGSAEEARAAAAAGCDLVVAQGVEAGGHVRGRVGLLPLLDDVLEAVDTPVVAAGGIGTARGVRAALAAGAAAARVGTRFIAARESAAHPAYVEAVIAAGSDDTVYTGAFSGIWPDAPHRVLRACLEAAEAFEGETVGEMRVGDQLVPVPRLSSPAPTMATSGTIAAMAMYAGQSVGAVSEVQPAADIVRELAGVG